MKKSSVFIISLVLTSAIILTSCGEKKLNPNKPTTGLDSHLTTIIKGQNPKSLPQLSSNRKDTMIIGIEAPDGVFNPIYGDSAYDQYVYESVFDGLFDIDEEGNPIKGVAKSWDISKDGLTYTFHMRDDVNFSDGTKVTAEDVAFTFTVVCDGSYTGVIDIGSIGIKGWEDYNKGISNKVSGINVKDPYTIEFTLDKPNASVLYSLNVGILSKKYYGKDYKQGNTSSIEALLQAPLGCGQYKLVSYKSGEEVDLVRNDNYYKGAPKIQNLIYKTTTEETKIAQLKTGEIDMDMVTVNEQNVEQIKSAGFLNIQMFPTNGYGYMCMNLRDEIFKDVKVRQALAIGLNRKAIVKTVYGPYADVCNEPQSKVSWTFAKDVNTYDYDTEKAKALLEEAGWKVGSDGIREKDGKKLTIHFSATTKNPVVEALIPIAIDDYKKLGIDFISEMKDFNTIRADMKSGKYQMFFIASGLTADPDASSAFRSKGSQNDNFYSNPKVDELLSKGLMETDKEKRRSIYQNIYKEINKDLPYIFMYQRRDMWVISSKIKNVNITPYKDFTFSLYKAEIK